MKNKLFLAIIYLLAAAMLFACSPTGSGGLVVRPDNPSDSGTHKDESSLTDSYILKNSVTEYKIVLPAQADATVLTAADELVFFMQRSTGIYFDIISDDGLVHTDNAKYISLGKTSLLESAGLTAEKPELGSDGFIIKTVGKTVYIWGAQSHGTINGAYEFLARAVGFEFYNTDTYDLNTGVYDVRLMNYDIVEVPDIMHRMANYGYLMEDRETLMRMRLRHYGEYFIAVDGTVFHTSFKFLPPKAHAKLHPKWYNKSQTQLCYTAGGNAEEYALMQAAALESLKTALRTYPDRDVVTFTIEDNWDFCSCSECTRVKDIYGENAASVILFLNDLNKAVKLWFASAEGEQYARDLQILFFAYQPTAEAPATLDLSSGEYIANGGLKCDDGVVVFYAPILADYMHNLTDITNAETYENAKAWRSVSKEMYLWTYSTNFKNYAIPYDTFNSMQNIYRTAASVGAKWLFDQAQHDATGAALGWSQLKGYLNAKLSWNVDSDYLSLIDKFFQANYGPADKKMREVFDSFRLHSESLKGTQGYDGTFSVYNIHSKENMWPKQLLLAWRQGFDSALGDIEPLKNSDRALYEKYYKHIVLERISVNYMLVTLYSYSLSDREILSLKLQVKEDAQLNSITRIHESGAIEDLYKLWNI